MRNLSSSIHLPVSCLSSHKCPASLSFPPLSWCSPILSAARSRIIIQDTISKTLQWILCFVRLRLPPSGRPSLRMSLILYRPCHSPPSPQSPCDLPAPSPSAPNSTLAASPSACLYAFSITFPAPLLGACLCPLPLHEYSSSFPH